MRPNIMSASRRDQPCRRRGRIRPRLTAAALPCTSSVRGTGREAARTMAGDTPASATRARLLSLYEAAVAAAHPDVCLPPHLPAPPDQGRIVVVGAGKAAAAMAAAAEN